MCWCFIHYWIEKCTVKQWNWKKALPSILKSIESSRATLVSYCLYELKKIGNKPHYFLTSFQISTHLVSYRISRTFSLWSTHGLMINLLSRQLIKVFYGICINRVQFTWQNAFRQTVKQAHPSSSMFKVVLILLSVTFLFLNPNSFSPSTF